MKIDMPPAYGVDEEFMRRLDFSEAHIAQLRSVLNDKSRPEPKLHMPDPHIRRVHVSAIGYELPLCPLCKRAPKLIGRDFSAYERHRGLDHGMNAASVGCSDGTHNVSVSAHSRAEAVRVWVLHFGTRADRARHGVA